MERVSLGTRLIWFIRPKPAWCTQLFVLLFATLYLEVFLWLDFITCGYWLWQCRRWKGGGCQLWGHVVCVGPASGGSSQWHSQGERAASSSASLFFRELLLVRLSPYWCVFIQLFWIAHSSRVWGGECGACGGCPHASGDLSGPWLCLTIRQWSHLDCLCFLTYGGKPGLVLAPLKFLICLMIDIFSFKAFSMLLTGV